MRNFLWFMVLSAGLVLFGCDSSESPKVEKTPVAQQSAKVEKETNAEAVKVVSTASETAQVVAEKVEKPAEQAVKTAGTAIEDVEKTASAAIDETVKVAVDTVAEVKKQTVAEVAAVKSALVKPVVAAQQATVPQEIVLEASKGNVTFPHGMHAEDFECSICHGDGTPAAFDLTKEVAHKVCKGCHKDEGAGPTGCSGCHKK